MSDDRELLEMAAKAAGYTWVRGITDAGGWWHENPDLARPWNPLTDDGDALRLAVKLRLPLQFDDWSDGETVLVHKGNLIEAENIVNKDPYAATRRAIVRAAAAIAQRRNLGSAE